MIIWLVPRVGQVSLIRQGCFAGAIAVVFVWLLSAREIPPIDMEKRYGQNFDHQSLWPTRSLL